MVALLRIVELDSGKILIDGVDTRTVGLGKLRSMIAVIPQDPVLFSVSLKRVIMLDSSATITYL
jgi:ABC-type multidrug transport system fused ATPase/permease subunit